jgi:arginase
MARIAVVDAPSILGLRPTGVEQLPEALKSVGLMTDLQAEYVGRVEPLPYDPWRDEDTRLLNPESIQEYSLRLAAVVDEVLDAGQFPLVLGGDCSILLGNALALRRRGRYGLVFLDGHQDFYHPEASPTGEVADVDLRLVSGRGPDVLSNIENRRPLLRDEDIVVFGFRDADEMAAYQDESVRDTNMHVFDLDDVRRIGVQNAAVEALEVVGRDDLAGFWIHLDADVLDDGVMPAVDYRLRDGLGLNELVEVLGTLSSSGRAVGVDVTIFNHILDPDGTIARVFTESIVNGLSTSKTES